MLNILASNINKLGVFQVGFGTAKPEHVEDFTKDIKDILMIKKTSSVNFG